jgi:hypothetical protein
MSQVRVDFIGDYSDLKKKTERAEAQLVRLRKKAQAQSRMMNMAFKKIGAGLSLFAVVNALKSAGEAAAEDAKQQRLLALQMKTTTNATKKQVAETESFIGRLSEQTGIMDDDLRPAFATLLRGTGKVAKAQKLLKIALDGSAASGKPLSAITQALVKADNGQLAALYKLAPQLKKSKGGIDSYAKSVQGAAKASADPYSKLSVVLANLEEQIGTALLPGFEALANFFIKNGPAISKFLEDIFNPDTKLGQSFAKIGDAIGKIFDSLDKFFMQFDPDKKSGVLGFFTVLQAALDTVATTLDVIINALNLITGNEAAQKILNGKDVASPFASAIDLGITKGAGIGAGGSNMSTLNPSSNYTINVNKSTIAASDIVREIQRYERQTGKKYLAR